MHTIHSGASVEVGVGVNVSEGITPGIWVTVERAGPSGKEVGTDIAAVGRDVTVDRNWAVGVVVGESSPKTTPTITRFAAVLAAKTAMTRRRIVMRMRISFSQCMDHLYSSDLGHWSVSQNSKMPFLV
jgi:hypothetical protein